MATENNTAEKATVKKTFNAGALVINKSDVVKIKTKALGNYPGIEKYHHIAKANGKGIVYVWDTREVVNIIDDITTVQDADLLKNVKDSATDLVITDNTPETAKVFMSI